MRSRSLFRRHAPHSFVRAQDDAAVELLLYDEIGFWGITAKQFAQQVAQINADTIHLRVNSPGGDVFDGVAMYNSLRQHSAQVITHIDGLAASIASVVALAGDEVRIAPNAFFMIHNPWGITIGDADLHRKQADTLDKIATGSIISTYRAKTGVDVEMIESWMDDETWFSAEQAADAGFVDVVEEAAPVEARVLPFDLSIYQHVPAGLRYAPPDDEWLTADQRRDLEATLRDEGLSRKDAVTAVSCLLEQLASATLATPSTPLRDEGRADPGRNAAQSAADALLASVTAGALNSRFAR